MGDVDNIGEPGMFPFRSTESAAYIDLNLGNRIKAILKQALQVFLAKGKSI
jgi:hypothetical protein